MGNKALKIGVFGAARGRSMIVALSQYDGVELTAICDKFEPLLDDCRKIASEHDCDVTMYTDFEEFFKHDMDAVVLANYANEHAPYAIRLLKSGRHVASEVLPVKNMAEAVELIEAVEESGKVYAYLENYCYFPSTFEMRKLYKQDVFGEFTHAEGEYIHNCENRWAELTYGDENHWRNTMCSTFYCTHSLGPIIHITGKRPVRVIGIENKPADRLMKYGLKSAEAAMEIIQMDNGAMVKSIHGNMAREPHCVWYSIYGNKGMAESGRWKDGELSINVYQPDKSEEINTYIPEPMSNSKLAKSITSHGGSDFYTVHYFIQKILGNSEGEESIGVYEALDMCIPGILAYRSICNGNIPIDIPNLRNKAERDQYRNDTWSTWGDGEQKAPYTGKGDIDIPHSVYEKTREKWLKELEEKNK